MRFIVLSDTHFGDQDCGLVYKEDGNYVLGDLYQRFLSQVGREYEYMILLGDIFDFAIEDYSDAYDAGKVFLNQLVKDKVVNKGFIYLQGNHDFSLWPLIEYESNIINRLKSKKKPKNFKNSLPAIIDARDGVAKFSLYGVRPSNEGDYDEDYNYGGLYLDHLIEQDGITFSIAYPNLYLFNQEGTTLFTHGHYVDTFWSLLSEHGASLTEENPRDPKAIYLDIKNIKDLVAVNLPLNQIASSGVGQSGNLATIINQVEHRLKDNKIGKVDVYLRNLMGIIKLHLFNKLPSFIKNRIFSYATNALVRYVDKAFKSYHTPRNNQSFVKDNQDKFVKYYELSSVELEELKGDQEQERRYLKYSLEANYKKPKAIVYGHTHVPTAWGDESEIVKIHDKDVKTCNTGGWLSRNSENFRGAEVFFIESDGSVSSKRVE